MSGNPHAERLGRETLASVVVGHNPVAVDVTWVYGECCGDHVSCGFELLQDPALVEHAVVDPCLEDVALRCGGRLQGVSRGLPAEPYGGVGTCFGSVRESCGE